MSDFNTDEIRKRWEKINYIHLMEDGCWCYERLAEALDEIDRLREENRLLKTAVENGTINRTKEACKKNLPTREQFRSELVKNEEEWDQGYEFLYDVLIHLCKQAIDSVGQDTRK